MTPILGQEQLDSVIHLINAANGMIREAHVISPSYFIEDGKRVCATSGNGGYLVRLLIYLSEGDYGAIGFIFEGVSQVNLPSGVELELKGQINDFQASIQFTSNPEDGFINGRKVHIEYHDRSIWGCRAHYSQMNPLDEDGYLNLDSGL